MPDLISERTVTARKPHHCQCCGTVAAQPGDTYRRSTYAYDGHAYTWISCRDCDDITADVWAWYDQPEEGVTRDDYECWAAEHSTDPRAVAYLRRAGIGADQ